MEWYNGETLHGESVGVIFLIVAGVIANLPVLIVYARSKHIRSITDKFLLNLLVADMIALTLLLPSILASFIHYSSIIEGHDLPTSSSGSHGPGDVSPGISLGFFNATRTLDTSDPSEMSDELAQTVYWKWSCTINKALISGVATASVLAALEIALERYLAVVTPLHYHKVLTTPTISLVSASGGLISLASFVISAFDPSQCVFPTCFLSHSKSSLGNRVLQSSNNQSGSHNQFENVLHSSQNSDETLALPFNRFEYDEATNLTNESVNDNEGRFDHPQQLIWAICNLIHIFLVFVLPVILMSFIYVRIYMEARRQKIRMTRRYKPYFLPVSPNHINPFDPSAEFKEKVGRFDPIFIRLRLMDRFRPPRLDRALRVAVFALVVTVLCWTPYYIVRGSHAIRTIMAMSGSSVSLNPHEANEDDKTQLPSVLSLDGGRSLVLANEVTKWNTAYPLLFASLHPLLASIFYAYRYKRLRLEILRAICDSLSFCCVKQDRSSSVACTSTTSRVGNGGLSNSSTCGGSPCIRQAIAIPDGETLITSGISNSPPDVSSSTNRPERDVPQIIVSSASGVHNCLSHPQRSDHSSISIRIDSVEDEAPQDLTCVPCEPRGESHVGLRRVESAVGSDGSSSEGIVRMERSMGTFVNCLTVWMNSYSRRWLQHRESVTSTASFITLLSSKYHNKAHPVANV